MDHLPGVDVSQPSGRNTIMPGCCSARLPYVASAELAKKKKRVQSPLTPRKKPKQTSPNHGDPPTTLGNAAASLSRSGPLLKQKVLC